MTKYFDLNELNNKPAPAASDNEILRDRFILSHEKRIEGLRDLCGALPQPGDIFFLWTLNSFNAFTFIPYLIRQQKFIDELFVTTYAINQRIVDSFLKLLEKKLIGSTTILISDTIHTRNPKVADYLKHTSQSKYRQVETCLSVIFAWNHSKITLARCGNCHYVIEGSGNWSENARHEQYIFLNSEKVFNFRKSCFYENTRSDT
jgi:hypothetical protein